MVSNEIYTGAGASVTFIPEMEFDVGAMTTETNGLLTIDNTDKSKVTWNNTGLNADKELVVNLYQGCMAKVTILKSNGQNLDTSGTGTYDSDEQRLLIKENGTRSITFNVNLPENTNTDLARVVIQSFGAPVYSPAGAENEPQLLSDGWLGLVQTITPPTIDVENKQYNLAMGVTRDFGFQFKGREVIGNGSLDIAVNNGSWLYYVLGTQAISASITGTEDLDIGGVGGEEQSIDTPGIFYTSATGKNTKILRTEGVEPAILPPLLSTDSSTGFKKITTTTNRIPDDNITYTFTASNGAVLPSFALEVTNQKGDESYLVDSDASSAKKGHESTWARIYTGCQVNSLTMSFEEGMELKSTIDFLSRRVFDAPPGYVVKSKVDPNPTGLFNYHTNQANNQPFMFSDGSIKIFGQEYARIKSGTLTITNTLTPHSFIGNYDRSITSAHVAGQRMYELSLTMLITDTEIWDKLRSSDEQQTTDLIELVFTKNTDEKITLKFDNYLVSTVDVPFPDDKSAIEVTMTATARTLNAAEYVGKWVIMG